MRDDTEEAALYKHDGCKYCTRRCRFNGAVASKDKATLSRGILFDCNSTRER